MSGGEVLNWRTKYERTLEKRCKDRNRLFHAERTISRLKRILVERIKAHADKEREARADSDSRVLWIEQLEFALDTEKKKVETMDLICRLAVRAKEVVFDDPGDACRWGEVVGEFESRLATEGNDERA